MADVLLNEKDAPKFEPKESLSLLAQLSEHGSKLPDLPVSAGAQAVLAGDFHIEHVNTNPALGDMFTPNADAWTQAAFLQRGFQQPFLGTELKEPAIAAGIGAVSGVTLTGMTEYGVAKLAEPVAKVAGAAMFSMLGATQAAAQILRAAPLPWYACITPRPLLLGAAGGALIAVSAYEIWKDHSK